ncbi:MAG: GntR family transcriptional regulator [Fusobacteriaceae bacterium]
MNLIIREKIHNENNRDYIYDILKQNILEFRLLPGDSISENDLSTLFDLSRTPIREAFIKLSEDGLLNIYPQKGSFISYIDLNSINESLFIRKSLEVSILKEAITSFTPENLKELKKIIGFQKTLLSTKASSSELFALDNKFHQVIFESCGKKNVWKFISNVSLDFTRIRFLSSTEKSSTKKVISQHEAIIKIIETKDFDAIEDLIDNHISNFLDKIEFLKENYRNYFKK